MPALAGRFRVLRFDTRGHGRSSASPPPYSIDGLADDLFAVMTARAARGPRMSWDCHWAGSSRRAAALRKPASFSSLS